MRRLVSCYPDIAPQAGFYKFIVFTFLSYWESVYMSFITSNKRGVVETSVRKDVWLKFEFNLSISQGEKLTKEVLLLNTTAGRSYFVEIIRASPLHMNTGACARPACVGQMIRVEIWDRKTPGNN